MDWLRKTMCRAELVAIGTLVGLWRRLPDDLNPVVWYGQP